LKLLAAYQLELEKLGLDDLGIRPQPHPSERRFVGSQKCGDCHTKAFATWNKTSHSHATDSLVKPPERVGISRHFDAECLSCHVTGWDPQGFFPYATGYENLTKSKHLVGSGCENCHGPGSAHVAAEEGGGKDSVLKLLREEMRLPLADNKAHHKCL